MTALDAQDDDPVGGVTPAQYAQQTFLTYWSQGCNRVSVWTAVHVGAVIFLVWSIAPWWFFPTWAVAIFALRLKIHRLARLYPHTANPVLVDERVDRIAMLSLASAGVHCTFLVLFPQMSDALRGMVTFLLLGTSVAAIASQYGNPRVYPYYTSPGALALAGCWAGIPGTGYSATEGWVMAVILLSLFTLITFAYGRANWRQFEESCAIRLREHKLNLQLTEALREAEKANQAKTRFLAAANHDLRQPLNVIGLVAGALQMRDLDAASNEMVKLLNKVSRALGAQLDGLLDISKLDAGLYRPEWTHVRLSVLLSQTKDAFQLIAKDKGLSVEVDVPDDVCVMTDPALLSRVVGNLCHNAIKFTHQGRVTLRAVVQQATGGASQQRVKLSVIDTGCGIPPAMHKQVFEEFVQLGNSQRDAAQGLGLGLPIVRRLCRLLDVPLRLESSPGEGTSVHLSLRGVEATQADSRSGELFASAPYRGRLQGKTVMVIDDDESVRLALQVMLEAMGCTVVSAQGLDDALAVKTASDVDLIVADVRLRDNENGISTAKVVSEMRGGVPVLLVTGDTAPDRLQVAEQAGFRLCHKPVPPERLVRELSELLALTASSR